MIGTGQQTNASLQSAVAGSALRGGSTRMALDNDAPAQIRDREVPSAMALQDASICRLEELVNHMESRLAPVLSPAPPTGEDKAVVRGFACGLADALGSFNRRTDALEERLAFLLRRLELP